MNDQNRRWILEDAQQLQQSVTREWIGVGQQPIHGVMHIEMRPVITGYGYLMEMYRPEWVPGNDRVGQIFTTCLASKAISAWHAHGETTDRLFVVSGRARIVLYDGREGSPSFGLTNEFRLGPVRPGLIVIPPRVWHGVQNLDTEPLIVINAVDHAYRYESPDHWKVPEDSPSVPYTFPP